MTTHGTYNSFDESLFSALFDEQTAHHNQDTMNWTVEAYRTPLSHSPSQFRIGGGSGADEPLNRVGKLLLLSAISAISSVGNIFVISSCLMDHHLKKRGTVFIVNTALADLIITGFSIPSMTVGLLASLNDWQGICRIQYYSVILVAFVSAPSLAAAVIDIRIKIGVGPDRYLGLATVNRLVAIVLIIWLSSGGAILAFIIFQLGPEVCYNTTSEATAHDGVISEWNWAIPMIIICIQVFCPVLLAAITHISVEMKIRTNKGRQYHYDGSLIRSNVGVFVLFLICWTPLVAVAIQSVTKSVPIRLFKQLQWLAMAKSCINPWIYGLFSKHYRQAFVGLFHYCCCKTSVSFSRRVRADSARPPSDVRVHIIPGYNVYSSVSHQGPHHRMGTASTSREPTSKPTPRPIKVHKIAKGSTVKCKEVYEL